jgi:hypothetical protein
MRELAAAALLLLALVVGALAPQIRSGDVPAVLASGRPTASGPLATVASATFSPPPSWRRHHGGASGFVTCGASDTWTRPALAAQNAHLASDPRYPHIDADDRGSEAWTPFHASALFYDGSSLSMRIDLVTLSGMWTDPHVGGNVAGCTSAEPQVWLFGYAPVRYDADNAEYAYLNVVPAPGYHLVVLTGTIRPQVVMTAGVKLAVLDIPATAVTATPTPLPKALPTAATSTLSPAPTFPPADRPIGLALSGTCAIVASSRHEDGLGRAWTVQCGSAMANLSVARAAIAQSWIRLDGPPLGVGLQTYHKDGFWMQIAYRLDGPGFADSFQVAQYTRPLAPDAPSSSAPSPFAYLRAPAGFELPSGCAWAVEPLSFTSEGAQKLPFVCKGIEGNPLEAGITRSLTAQGWVVERTGAGSIRYGHEELRLTLTFADESAAPSRPAWFVEALCCFSPG